MVRDQAAIGFAPLPVQHAKARRAKLGVPTKVDGLDAAIRSACSGDATEGGAGVLAAMTTERIGSR